MENASKALLIAGAILIAILLIATGVKLFNSTKGTTDSVETTMTSTEIATFNSEFMQYIGEDKSKFQTASLLRALISNNATNTHKIEVTFHAAPTESISSLKKGLEFVEQTIDKSGAVTFDVEILAYDKEGRISELEIR